MSTTYPSMLPRPMISGYGLKVTSAATSTDMDRGSARRRRTATKSKTVLDFSVALTDEQYAIFAAWWRYDLYDGTLPATMQILNGYADDPTTIQFLKPYTATDQLGKWYISFQVEFEPFRLSESDLDAMIAGGTIYTLPPEVPGGPGIFPFYGYLRITQQPVSQSVLQPDSATFTIAAVGTGTLSYQWKKNGVNVGTNSTTYNTGATTWTGTDDVITCVVSNGVTSLTSDNATLNVRKLIASNLPNFPETSTFGGGGILDDGLVYASHGHSNTPCWYKGSPELGNWSNSGLNQPPNAGTSHSCFCESETHFYHSFYSYNISWTQKFYSFNKSTKTWTALTPFPRYADNLFTCSICYDAVRGSVIAFCNATAYGGSGQRLYEYNISSDSWTLLKNYGLANHFNVSCAARLGDNYYIRNAGNTGTFLRVSCSDYSYVDTGISPLGLTTGIVIDGLLYYTAGSHLYSFDGSNQVQSLTLSNPGNRNTMVRGLNCIYIISTDASVQKISM